ncbi:uncharacterized protein LOC129905886 [Episyrphus balteatus]|uniref:uncharacterized protein LOC129905886 n=1 Tax=Episyrphus balteatus TaxID=286459 RepID=UPI0024856374|nr:uncharacterized protein LOC129905886 [Episyrphus balteatus]
MYSKMGCKWMLTVGVIIVTFLAATKQTNAQIYLLNYSDERVNAAKLAEKRFDLVNNTDITEVYTINTSTRISSDLSQSTMDAITIVWYVSTFLALVAFFSLMACSDRKCGRRTPAPTLDDQLQAPPSPAPSYSEFAPPSYETVFKKHYSPTATVFVVQVPYIETEKDKDPPPPFTFHTINELQKFSC